MMPDCVAQGSLQGLGVWDLGLRLGAGLGDSGSGWMIWGSRDFG